MNENENLFKAIENYNRATYDLAKVMANIKNIHGRQFLEDATQFDLCLINNLCRYGSVSMESPEIISLQHYNELVGESELYQRKILSQIVRDRLKPSQVRKLIRNKNKSTKELDPNKIKVKVNSWQKNLILLENDLKRMDSDTRARALGFVTNAILQPK
jgi:hypothetical protein